MEAMGGRAGDITASAMYPTGDYIPRALRCTHTPSIPIRCTFISVAADLAVMLLGIVGPGFTADGVFIANAGGGALRLCVV